MQVIVFNSHPQTLTERKTLSELFHMIGFAMFFLTFHFFFFEMFGEKVDKTQFQSQVSLFVCGLKHDNLSASCEV